MDIYDKDHILSFRDRIKKYIKDNNVATDFSENTFGEVIEALQQGKSAELNAVRPTNTMQVFIDGNAELYNYAKSIKNILNFPKYMLTKRPIT
jgi:DNA helicase-2/ATP-dependent DNA helicase PcrA